MLNKPSWLLVIALTLQHHESLCRAFSTYIPPAEHSCQIFRPSTYSGPSARSPVTALQVHSKDEHGDFFDVEAARTKLESLVAGGGVSGEPPRRQLEEFSQPTEKTNSAPLFSAAPSPRQDFLSTPEKPVLDITLPACPPLTTIERARREAELELLSTLDMGDESLADIWELWFSERGGQTSELLHKADDFINAGKEHWGEAEKILRKLIAEHGVHFVEPVNRMATLYQLQGRMEDALTLNKIVLSVKPWHFGALSHIVIVYAALGDNESARQWAAFRLPTFTPDGPNRRRTRWVGRAVAEAKELLQRGEDDLSKVFGAPDQPWIDTQNKIRHMYDNGSDNDADAWQ